MLTANVQSADDLMSIALCAEHEAVRRYTLLAANMREHRNEAAASLFERMIREEREHERLIEQWAQVEGIELRTDIRPIVWEDPQVATVYDSDATDPAHSSPYRALAFAVHNEERAFRFYTHVAANAADEAVREYAEILAREELGHAALLRAMRRRAWHTEQESAGEEPDLDPGSIHCLADLLSVAASIEHCLSAFITAVSADYPELQKLSTTVHQSLTDIETQLHSSGEPTSAISDTIKAINTYADTAEKRAAATSSLQRLCSDSDRCFAFYDAVVTRTKDEAVMLAAQRLSESALDRIKVLRHTLATPP